MDIETTSGDQGPSSPERLRTLFYTLISILAGGVVLAVVLAGIGVGSLGLFEAPAAFTALGIAVAAVAVSLVVTYAFLPGILADERRYTDERAQMAAWTEAQRVATSGKARVTEALEGTADAIRAEVQADTRILRDQHDLAVGRLKRDIEAVLDDIAAHDVEISVADHDRSTLRKEVHDALEETRRLRHRFDEYTKQQQVAIGKLTRSIEGAEHTQGERRDDIEARLARLDDYVDHHESRHTVLEAALAFDTEELATLEARLGEAGGRGAPLSEVAGIEERYVKALARLGIKDTEALRRANARDLARKLRAFPGQVHAWQAMAELMRVPGIGPQYASLLEANGIHSMHDLANADAAALVEALEARGGKGGHVGRRVEQWITTAKKYVEA